MKNRCKKFSWILNVWISRSIWWQPLGGQCTRMSTLSQSASAQSMWLARNFSSTTSLSTSMESTNMRTQTWVPLEGGKNISTRTQSDSKAASHSDEFDSRDLMEAWNPPGSSSIWFLSYCAADSGERVWLASGCQGLQLAQVVGRQLLPHQPLPLRRGDPADVWPPRHRGDRWVPRSRHQRHVGVTPPHRCELLTCLKTFASQHHSSRRKTQRIKNAEVVHRMQSFANTLCKCNNKI